MNFMSSVINFFKDGGVFLYPLALIFVVGVSIAIERYVYLTRETIRNRTLWDNLVPALSSGNFKQVVRSDAEFEGVDRHDPELRSRPSGERAAPRRHREGDGREPARSHSAHRKAHALPIVARQCRPAHRLARHHHRPHRRLQRGSDRESGGKSQFAGGRHFGRHEQYGIRFGRCHHAVAGAHVSRVEDHVADRQLGDCLGEIPEFDHGAPESHEPAALAPQAPAPRAPAAARGTI